jgi:hypothetical protein
VVSDGGAGGGGHNTKAVNGNEKSNRVHACVHWQHSHRVECSAV